MGKFYDRKRLQSWLALSSCEPRTREFLEHVSFLAFGETESTKDIPDKDLCLDAYLKHQELNSNDSSNKVDFALVNRKMPNQTDHKELNSDVFDEFIVNTDIVHLFTIMKEFASKKLILIIKKKTIL